MVWSISGLDCLSDQDLATIVSIKYHRSLMLKLVILAIAIWLIVTILKRYRKGMSQSDSASHKTNHSNGEPMVQCAYCGVHLPESESVESQGQFFCSQAHIHAPKDEG